MSVQHVGVGSAEDLEARLDWSDVVEATSLGALHWRTRVPSISINVNGEERNVQLGRSVADTSSVYPIAVLDSGGANMLATRAICDAVYGAWDISAAQDGTCMQNSLRPALSLN